MYKVLVGGISPEGEHLLTSYLEKFMPDTQIEPLKAAGIKGRMKNHATRQDVLLVILDDMLWDACVGVVDAVLALPKVHKYESDEGLKEFLVSKFGPLDLENETGTVPPDMLMGQEAPEDEFVPRAADFSKDSSTGDTVPPDRLSSGPLMVDDELPTTDETDEVAQTDSSAEVIEKLQSQNRDLQSQLAGKESLIRNLTLQLNDKTASDQDDIAALVGRIRELEGELEKKTAQLSESGETNRVNSGKVEHAEQILGEFEELRRQVKASAEERAALTKERDGLAAQVKTMEAEIGGLREQAAEADALRKDLAERTKRVGVLEQELATKTSIISEFESESADHQGVVTELAQLRSEIAVMQQQIDADKERLKLLDDAKDKAEKELSERQLEVDNLRADLRAMEDKLSMQDSDEEHLKVDLQLKQKELEEAKKALEACQADLKAKAEELEACEQAKNEALSQASSSSEYSQSLVESTELLSKRLTELQDELNEKSSTLEKVMARLKEAEDSAASLAQQLEAAQSSLEAKTSECERLAEELATTRGDLTSKTNEYDTLSKQLHDYQDMTQTGMSSLQGQVSAKDSELEDLRKRLEVKETTITSLTTDISGLHEQLAAKDGEITQIHEQLAAVRKQLLDAQSSGDEARVNADTRQQALDKLIGEKDELEDKLVAAQTKRIELENRITELENELQQERSYRGSLDDSNVELTAQNEKFSNRIQQLEEELVRSKTDEDLVSRLESDLLEERRRSARLQSEVDVMKRTSGTEKASDLRVEIVRLKNELLEVKNSTVDAAEAETLRKQLKEARDRSAQLELALVDKDSQINSVMSSVFAQLQNIAMPKAAYDFKFGSLGGLSDKFVVMASGSEESTANVYQVLRSACTAARKKVIIVDLVTDSSIDREFGIKSVVSPIDWLTGAESFRKYIADTRLGHVKVLSTALAYINDLFLMNVDWQSRLGELDAFSADVVVLYVGCLNNLVTKVLFDMFSKAMKAYVICKATPANIRTTILNLTGFPNLSPSVTVECVNFSDTASAGMYQRLVAKYKAQVLRDNEVLPL